MSIRNPLPLLKAVLVSLSLCVIGSHFVRASDRPAHNEPPSHPFPHAPAWVADQTLYEVNLRQFSPEGNLEGFQKQLPRLKDLGVGTLWFMPVNPIGVAGRSGTLGSPYAVKDYTQFNLEFGTVDQFKAVVDEAHRMGMYVIIDWVANHTALDNPWVQQHPDWYKHDGNGQIVHPMPDWLDVAALNYESPALRREMIESMAYWVRDVGVDGFRCDSAEFVPLDFWVQARDTLRQIKPVFMLAEGNKPELMTYAFDSVYAWDLPVNMEGIAKGTKTVNDLINFFHAEGSLVPSDRIRLNFTTNHDKNSWEGTTREKLGAGVDAFTVLTFTAPGIPLIYDGQETGTEHRLKFFDRDPIVWRDDPAARLYSTLARLKRNNFALWDGVRSAPMQFIRNDATSSILIFKREAMGDSVVVMLNLGNDPARAPIPDGVADLQIAVRGNVSVEGNGTLLLKPSGYVVWSNR
jgi:glycosidase